MSNPRSATEIQEWLVNNIAEILKVNRKEIDVHAPLTSFGLESLTLFTIAGDLANWLGHDIDATLLWEHPNIAAIADVLGSR